MARARPRVRARRGEGEAGVWMRRALRLSMMDWGKRMSLKDLIGGGRSSPARVRARARVRVRVRLGLGLGVRGRQDVSLAQGG